MIQWLRLHAFNAEAAGPILGQATKIPQARWFNQKKKRDSEPKLGILRKIMEGLGYP